MSAKIEIDVVVNNPQAIAGLKKTQAELVNTGKTAKGLDDTLGKSFTKTGNVFAAPIKGVETFTKKITEAVVPTQKLGTSLTDLSSKSQQSKVALTGIGDSISKLPSSISNVTRTISPLLKEIIGFATGGAVFTVVGVALSLLGDHFDKAAEAAARTAKATAEAKKEFDGIVSSVAKEVGQVEVLVASFGKENLSRKEKSNIIQELQRISPAYFGTLDKENTTVAQLTTAYNAYSASIVRTIELKVREGQLNKVIERRLELQDKSVKRTNIEVGENGKIVKSINAIYDADSKGFNQSFNNALLTQKEQKELNDLFGTEKELLTDIANLKQPQDFNTVDHTKAKTAKKDVKSIGSELLELSKTFDYLNAIELLPDFGPQTKEKISALLNTVKTLIKDFNVAPDDTLISKLLGFNGVGNQTGLPANIPGVEGLKQRIVGQLTDAITPKAPINIQVPVRPEVIINDAALEDIKQKIVITGEQISAALETTLENAAINFGELLGSTLTGGADIGDFFDSLFGQIGAGLKQLGQYFIKTAIEIKIFKEFATKYPLLALAAGVALVALGSVIQNSTAKKKAFAVGGRVPGTGNTDSVDAILTPGEFVIRKSAAQALGADNLSLLNQGIVPSGVSIGAGEQLIRVVGETVVAGNDLRIILNRANATYGRNA